ncbi:MAG: hypothetical protein IT369_10385 [Candidatus Latescibacteria bacterium]|nr:hypothetical protein [Candidatus Latescibacterota bacterium]
MAINRRDWLVVRAGAVGLVLLACGAPAWGWWAGGHALITRAAVQALPGEMPEFFRQGAEAMARLAPVPDAERNPALSHLRSAGRGEHFLDLELLGGKALPDQRYDFLKLCAAAGQDPAQVGTAPYAVAEWTERLALAFAQHRRWPANTLVQSECLTAAGHLAHYAEDLCQPLHTTLHYDGRAGVDGKSPRSGIHEKVDALPEKLKLDPAELAKGLAPVTGDSLMPLILAQLQASNGLVDSVYALEGELDHPESARVRAFAEERSRAAAALTAGLYLRAWAISASVELPGWLQRD